MWISVKQTSTVNRRVLNRSGLSQNGYGVGGWMDGWIGGWVDGWMGGWMGEWMHGWMDAWDGWMGWMDEMDGWMDGYT